MKTDLDDNSYSENIIVKKVKMVSIDWTKAEERPDKKLSIEGKYLLELRNKINELEQVLIKKQEELERITSEWKITKDKLAGREISLTELTERRSSARKSLDKVKEQKLHTDIEVTKLRAAKAELGKKLTEAVAKITNLEKQLSVNVRNSEEMERKILIKEINIQNKEQDMLDKVKELLKKDEEIKGYKNEINNRDKDIEFLKEELKKEMNKTYEQIKKYTTFELQTSKAIRAAEILSQIKSSIQVKGWLADKELEELLEDWEK